jgi:hypothetical protein
VEPPRPRSWAVARLVKTSHSPPARRARALSPHRGVAGPAARSTTKRTAPNRRGVPTSSCGRPFRHALHAAQRASVLRRAGCRLHRQRPRQRHRPLGVRDGPALGDLSSARISRGITPATAWAASTARTPLPLPPRRRGRRRAPRAACAASSSWRARSSSTAARPGWSRLSSIRTTSSPPTRGNTGPPAVCPRRHRRPRPRLRRCERLAPRLLPASTLLRVLGPERLDGLAGHPRGERPPARPRPRHRGRPAPACVRTRRDCATDLPIAAAGLPERWLPLRALATGDRPQQVVGLVPGRALRAGWAGTRPVPSRFPIALGRGAVSSTVTASRSS